MKKLLVLGAVSLVLISSAVFASTTKTVEHAIPLDGVQHIEVNNGVGTITIRRTGGRIEADSLAALEVEFDGEKSGWLSRDKDVSDMDVEIQRNGDTLVIRFEEDDVNAEFVLEIPDPERLSINLGVGEITAQTGYTHVDANLGVGDINIESLSEAVSTVAMDVGVGDVQVTGATHSSSSRAMVSESITAEGTGEYRIRVEVGVGDARVSL
ncbi:MAG: hypothetical protein HLUCCO02_05780 [Idiomarinaceae bacterium HL-53]|nr:MAG: hypothetical protein HLUCCO02_05780 [Idiomarinaceae bacterium HL-53]CUS48063.1 hypothetical protein Ga0003345_1002 [Idiomarinaceae bacterium HL-53]